MGDSWNKKEREKKKQQEKKEKEARKKERKENAASGNDSMIAYVDENGNISDTPPDPRKRKEIKLEDIEIGVPEYVPPTEEELTHTGKVTFFNHEKGFGFIKDQQTQQSVFVHINNLSEPVNENDKVSFEIGHGPKGPMAVNVKKQS
ncbi:MAG: cold shock domain-containing protein [Chitinophagaceae bacterium]|nr:cold shock domain-containing protein [Chitinophagaceae bacterium]